MITIVKKIWNELANRLSSSCKISRIELVCLIQQVVNGFKKGIDKDMFSEFPIFKFYLRDDISNYIVENAPRNDDYDSVKRIILEKEPSTDTSRVSLLAEILRGLVEYKTSLECSNCNDDDLIAMYDNNRSKLLLVCNTCGWVQDLNGAERKVMGYLTPAKKELLKENNLID